MIPSRMIMTNPKRSAYLFFVTGPFFACLFFNGPFFKGLFFIGKILLLTENPTPWLKQK
jgi:hypothetical protein